MRRLQQSPRPSDPSYVVIGCGEYVAAEDRGEDLAVAERIEQLSQDRSIRNRTQTACAST
jgi:hypothetical protein